MKISDTDKTVLGAVIAGLIKEEKILKDKSERKPAYQPGMCVSCHTSPGVHYRDGSGLLCLDCNYRIYPSEAPKTTPDY
jgi:hypothetical protein